MPRTRRCCVRQTGPCTDTRLDGCTHGCRPCTACQVGQQNLARQPSGTPRTPPRKPPGAAGPAAARCSLGNRRGASRLLRASGSQSVHMSPRRRRRPRDERSCCESRSRGRLAWCSLNTGRLIFDCSAHDDGPRRWVVPFHSTSTFIQRGTGGGQRPVSAPTPYRTPACIITKQEGRTNTSTRFSSNPRQIPSRR